MKAYSDLAEAQEIAEAAIERCPHEETACAGCVADVAVDRRAQVESGLDRLLGDVLAGGPSNSLRLIR